MVICLERGADLHMAQLMPLPLTVSSFSKIRIGFTFLVLAHPGSPGQWAVELACMCAVIQIHCTLQVSALLKRFGLLPTQHMNLCSLLISRQVRLALIFLVGCGVFAPQAVVGQQNYMRI